jgi:hypothetical protein
MCIRSEPERRMAPIGIRLFGASDGKPVALRRTALAESGQITDLRFGVARS